MNINSLYKHLPEDIANIALGYLFIYPKAEALFPKRRSLLRYLRSIVVRTTTVKRGYEANIVEHLVDGILHSMDDEPAVIYGNSRYWYFNAHIHRSKVDNDGLVLPAIIRDNKNSYELEWYRHGSCHRDDKDTNGKILPAVIIKIIPRKLRNL